MTVVTTAPTHLELCPHCGIHAVTKWPHKGSRMWTISCHRCRRYGGGDTQSSARYQFTKDLPA